MFQSYEIRRLFWQNMFWLGWAMLMVLWIVWTLDRGLPFWVRGLFWVGWSLATLMLGINFVRTILLWRYLRHVSPKKRKDE